VRKLGKWAALAAIGGLAAVQGAPALAAIQTWDFDSSSHSFSASTAGNTLSMTSADGIGLTVRSFSDTGDIAGDDLVETAELIWAQSGSLGVKNNDEGTDSPNHAVDSFLVGGDVDGEFDMLLLEFDTAVSLDGFDLSWVRDGNNSSAVDMSILAFDGTGSSAVTGGTWADILSSNGGNYDSIGNFNNVGLSYYTVGSSVQSTHFLIGVYNPIFGSGSGLDGNEDGFKLDLVQTSTPDDEPPNEVPLPGSLSLLLLGLGLLQGRARARRRNSSA